ncbi:MAG: DUF4199 domain-containing protein [Bacteroidetes bacterium]|nr:DUF4199 domain-containing protein [Bacteroidota bacterium]
MTTFDNPTGIPNASTVSVWPTALRYGIIGGVLIAMAGLIFNLTGLSDPSKQGGAGNTVAAIVNYGLMIGTIILVIKNHRDADLGGYITFGRSIGVGTATGLILGVVGAIWTYIFFTFIDPGLVDQIREMAYDQAIERGSTPEQMEQAKGFMEFFTSPGFFTLAVLFGGVIFGVIVSLIAGAIMKKDPPVLA